MKKDYELSPHARIERFLDLPKSKKRYTPDGLPVLPGEPGYENALPVRYDNYGTFVIPSCKEYMDASLTPPKGKLIKALETMANGIVQLLKKKN